MKINFDTPITDFDGIVLTDGGTPAMAEDGKPVLKDGKPVTTGEKPFTVGRACLAAIGAGTNDEKTPEKVMALYALGMRLTKGGEIEISTEEATTLKRLVAKAMVSPMHSGQVCCVLDGQT